MGSRAMPPRARRSDRNLDADPDRRLAGRVAEPEERRVVVLCDALQRRSDRECLGCDSAKVFNGGVGVSGPREQDGQGALVFRCDECDGSRA